MASLGELAKMGIEQAGDIQWKCKFKKITGGRKPIYLFLVQAGERILAVADGQLTSGGVTYEEECDERAG